MKFTVPGALLRTTTRPVPSPARRIWTLFARLFPAWKEIVEAEGGDASVAG